MTPKKLSIFLIFIICLLGASALYVTRDTGASHPALANNQLSPLIPTRAFYAAPRAESEYIVSNDGKLVIFLQTSDLGGNIIVKELAGWKEIARFPVGLSSIRWHPSKPLIRFIYQGHDWEVDPNFPERKSWKSISPIKLSDYWEKIQFASDEQMPVLVWGKTHFRGNGHIWLVSQDGSTARKVAEGTPETVYWAFDHTETSPVLRVDILDPSTLRMFRNTDSGWEKLIDIDVFDTFSPESFVRSDGTLIARSARNRDKAVLVEFDTKTGAERVLLENPDADIGFTIPLTHRRIPDLVHLGSNTLEYRALTDRGEVFLNILSEFPQPVDIDTVYPTASGRYVTAAISPQGKSYIFLLIDLVDGSHKVLSEYYFRRFKDDLVQEQFITFNARDGLEIPAVLSMPKHAVGPIPFVLHIHGGPRGHTPLGYDHETQFLVNRGLGVLSVNFRGSDGFGKLFQSKGFKQFGRTMQNDITDAAKWLIESGRADPSALAVMGASYGGYSAALAMTRDPGLFAAAIVEFPMLDVEFQSRHPPGAWLVSIDLWQRYFGKPDNPEDVEQMRKYSLSNLVSQIHGPIMVLVGNRDQITGRQQVIDFEQAATSEGKDIDVHYFPDAGHGVTRWQDKLKRARLIEGFLADHIGGRSDGFEFGELATEFFE